MILQNIFISLGLIVLLIAIILFIRKNKKKKSTNDIYPLW